MNKNLVSSIAPTTPISAAQQAFALKTILQWFNQTPLEIRLTKAQTSQLIAACYDFKSFEAFRMAQLKLMQDNRVLPQISTDLQHTAQKIDARLEKMKIPASSKLISLILADYLIKATNNMLAVEYIHETPSAFLNYLIQNAECPTKWGSNPFYLAHWANEVGHLGSGSVLMREHKLFAEQIRFYKKNLLDQQLCFGKISYRTKGDKQYSIPVLTKTTDTHTIKNFEAIADNYSPNKLLNLLKIKDAIIKLITVIFREKTPFLGFNDLHGDESSLSHFTNIDYLKNADITKITCSSTVLDLLFDLGLNKGLSPNTLIENITKTKSGEEWRSTLTLRETFGITLYGMHQGFVFKHLFQLSSMIEQSVKFQNILLGEVQSALKHSVIKPFTTDHRTIGLLGDIRLELYSSIQIKNDTTTLNNSHQSKLSVQNEDTLNTHKQLIDLLVEQLNKFVFSNKYPMEIAYNALVFHLKHIQETPKIAKNNRNEDCLDEAPDSFDWESMERTRNELILESSSFPLSKYFSTTKKTSKTDQYKFLNKFLSRYPLVFIPLDKTKPCIDIEYDTSKRIIIAYNKSLKDKGYCLNSREFNQKELDLFSSQINYLLNTGSLAVWHDFDLSQGRYKLLSPQEKRKYTIIAQTGLELEISKPETDISEFLSKKQRNALFDNASSAKPVVIRSRFKSFFNRYNLALLDEHQRLIKLFRLSDNSIFDFKCGYRRFVFECGMPKNKTLPRNELDALNKLITALLKSGELTLPSHLVKEGFAYANFVLKS